MKHTKIQTHRECQLDSLQEQEYEFPYHYVPQDGPYPVLSRRWGFSVSYIAAIRLVKEWFREIEKKVGHIHMDYGCGDGGFIQALRSDVDFNEVNFRGIDLSSKAIDWAEMFSGKQGLFRCIDINELEADFYDSGTLIEVFEHIPPAESEKFIDGLYHSLKNNAQLFVTVPSTQKPLIGKHYRHFDFECITRTFDSRFDILEVFGFEKIGYISKLFKRGFMGKSLYLETLYTSNYMIKELASKHSNITGCGRIALVLRKRS